MTQVRQGGLLAGLHIPVEVEQQQLRIVGQLLELQHVILNVLATLEQLVHVRHMVRFLGAFVPSLPSTHVERTQSLRIELDLSFIDECEAVAPADFRLGQGRHLDIVVQEDIGCRLLGIEQGGDVVEFVEGEILCVLGQLFPNPCDLLRRSLAVNWDEGSDHFYFLEPGRQSGQSFLVEEDGVLVEPCEEVLEVLLFLGGELLELGEEVEQAASAVEMGPGAFMQGVSEYLHNLDHWVQIVEMEAESIPVGGLVEISTAHAVPQGHISIDLSGHKLRQPTQAGHSLAILESVQQVLSGIRLNRLQKLDFSLIDQVPDDGVVEVQVTQDLASSNQLGNRVVSHLHM